MILIVFTILQAVKEAVALLKKLPSAKKDNDDKGKDKNKDKGKDTEEDTLCHPKES